MRRQEKYCSAVRGNHPLALRPLSLDSASFGTVSLIVTRRLAREVSACSKNSKDSVTRMVSGER